MDRQQFIECLESGQKSFRRFLTALCCGDTALADDLAQETYVKAYLASDSLKDTSKFPAWVRSIAYNTFISDRRICRKCVGFEEMPDAPSDDTADSSFRYQALNMALARLSEKERMAIVLYYMEGYGTEEIAEIAGCSADAVRQQLSRGRMRLRQIMTPDMK